MTLPVEFNASHRALAGLLGAVRVVLVAAVLALLLALSVGREPVHRMLHAHEARAIVEAASTPRRG